MQTDETSDYDLCTIISEDNCDRSASPKVMEDDGCLVELRFYILFSLPQLFPVGLMWTVQQTEAAELVSECTSRGRPCHMTVL